MAYLGIGETQLQILDNEQNRNLVKEKILADYIDKFVPTNQDEINKKMIATLATILSNMKLYQLLVLTAEDCEVLIWNNIFDYLKDNVCEMIFGAKRFFEVGGDAELQDDEFWDEYHNVLDMLPITAYDFMRLKFDAWRWANKVKEVCEYVGKVMPCKCKWVAYSNDGSYEDFSRGSFDNKKDCYNDMRNAVLEKMKWNTEYDEDFPCTDDAVGYKVRFTQDMIIHTSFSGTYVYKIVGADDAVKIEDIFTEELNQWLVKNDMNWY